MELKYILRSRAHRTTEAGETWTYEYVPTLEEYKKHCKFTVTTNSPSTTMDKLNLPICIGDIIIMDFKPKNIQETFASRAKKAAA